MKQPYRLITILRAAGLLAIFIFGLVSIIATGGSGGNKIAPAEKSLSYPEIDDQYRQDADLGKTTSTYYRDLDGDGYGDPNDSAEFETEPIGYYVTQGTDCDDTDKDINPGAPEACGDNIDNNCDGLVDVGCVLTCTDADGDGYYVESDCKGRADCDDTRAGAHPGAVERCSDGVDNDCNGEIDEEGCYFAGIDMDGDGYYADDGDNVLVDCDDTDIDVNPGLLEACGDGRDNNCNGQVDENCPRLPPDSGMTACYSNDRQIACPDPGSGFYGQDASYTINPPAYTKLDAHGRRLPNNAASWAMIRDDNTGLIWEAKTDDGGIHDKDNRYNWYSATDAFIPQLNAYKFGDYSDWRIPTGKELMNIVNYGDFDPSVSPFFSYTVSSDYWSSTAACLATYGWKIDFRAGIIHDGKKSDYCYVRAVRGDKSSPILTDNGDGTISDKATGLMWMQATGDMNDDGVIDVGDGVTWQTALSRCEKSTFAGYNDWRLPTIKELASIVDSGVCDPVVNDAYFKDTVSDRYWSSTSASTYNRQDQALCINFRSGDAQRVDKLLTNYVRAVRGGQ